MPARAPSCRKAARSILNSNPSNIWITDDILDNAFHRFLRVSRTAKRFGSNVPGPLEAQRRLAKRRMMGLAAVGGPPTFDVGVLFCDGPPRRDQLGWAAPRAPGRSQGPQSLQPPVIAFPQSTVAVDNSMAKFLDQFLNVFDDTTPKQKELYSPIKTRLKGIHTLGKAKALAAEARACGMDHLEYSKLAYEALLANGSSLKVLLDFLKDPSVNLPEAHNITAFMAHCEKHNKSWDQSPSFRATIQQLLGLGMVQSFEISYMIDKLRDSDFSMLQAIWDGMKACRIVSIHPDDTRQLLQKTKTQGYSRRLKDMSCLQLELYQYLAPVEPQDSAKQPDLGDYLAFWATSTYDRRLPIADTPTFDELILLTRQLGAHWGDYIVAATKILVERRVPSGNDHVELRLLILHWLDFLRRTKIGESYLIPHKGRQKWNFDIYIILAEHFTLRDLAPHFEKLSDTTTCDIITECWLGHLCMSSWSLTGIQPRDIIAKDLMVRPATTLHSGQFARTTDRFADIVIAVARNGFEYEATMVAIVDLCRAMFGTRGIFQLCSTWRLAQLRIYPEAFGEILRELSNDNPHLALKLYHRGRLWIGSSPDLVVKLIEQGTPAYHIYRILEHKDPTNSVPVGSRQTFNNPLHNSRITLIHMVADAFSQYKGARRSRQMFRYVWLAYQYLRSHNAPVHPLMSIALVRAGIVLPLQRAEWVNTGRVRWILSVVRRVEGEEVAKNIDEMVYVLRGNVAKLISARTAYMQSRGIEVKKPPINRRSSRRAMYMSIVRSPKYGKASSLWVLDDRNARKRTRNSGLKKHGGNDVDSPAVLQDCAVLPQPTTVHQDFALHTTDTANTKLDDDSLQVFSENGGPNVCEMTTGRVRFQHTRDARPGRHNVGWEYTSRWRSSKLSLIEYVSHHKVRLGEVESRVRPKSEREQYAADMSQQATSGGMMMTYRKWKRNKDGAMRQEHAPQYPS